MTEPPMPQSPEERLVALGLQLPAAPKPVASYVPCVRTGNLLFISGQIPVRDGKPAFRGRVGKEVSVEDAAQAARLCVLNGLAVAKAELEDLSKVRRVVRAVGHVATADGFSDVHVVTNGASDLLVEVLGDRGRHSRLALGAASLPLDVPFELDLVLEVD